MKTKQLASKVSENIQSIDSVLVFGHFSTVHAGHIRHLKYAKELSNEVIVALTGDSCTSRGMKYSQKERAEALNYIDIIDQIVLLEGDELADAVRMVKPKILLLGKEHECTDKNNLIKAIKEQRESGREVIFDAGETHYATSRLLEQPYESLHDAKRKEYQAVCARRNIVKSKLLESIEYWEAVKLLVIGDTIVDQYAACEALGMSAEAPVIVVRELNKKNFIGGAAIVASHISELGPKCHYISIVGDDSEGMLVRKTLKKKGISFDLITDKTRPTTFKKRYLVESQKLFRVSRLDDKEINQEIETLVMNKIENAIKKVDGIVISDFVYGVITEKILQRTRELAKEHNIKLFGDVQSSSQIGDVTRFVDFDLICPNEREARIALQDKDSGIEALSQKILATTKARSLVMKLGAEGFILYESTKNDVIKRISFPTLTLNPLDVTGAGDAILSLMATGLSANQDIITCAALSCCIAAAAVETMGNTPIRKEKLMQKIEEVFI